MKSPFLLSAAVLLSLGIGIVIGRKTTPESDYKGSDTARHDGTKPSDYRSSQLDKSHGSSRHGGGPAQARINNKVRHVSQLAKDLNMEQGMPDFDALFGIWETASGMTPQEIKLALKQLNTIQLPRRSAMFMKAMLVMQWAKKDGPSAMVYTLSEKNKNRSSMMTEMTLQAWANNDPNGAYNWYEANKEILNPRDQKQFEAQAVASMAKENFGHAFEIAKNADSGSRNEVFENLGSAVANNPEQRDKILRYLQTLGDQEIFHDTGSNMAEQIAMTSIQDAMAFVDKWPGENKSDIARGVAKQWGQIEPEKAMAWKLGMIGGDDKPTDAVKGIFSDWARRTPDEAKSWLNKQDGLNQDQLRAGAADQMSWEDEHQRAASWISEIQDEKLRNRRYKSIYYSWAQDDKEGSQRWLETLDEDTRTKVGSVLGN